MKLLKAKQQSKPVEPAVSLTSRIKSVCAEAEAYIETKVDALKASEDGKALPRTWLAADLRRRHGSCSCKVALSLLEEESNG